MKNTFVKSCLRDWGRSKSRIFAIVAIVALGAGFFGGIKATSIDMKLTADAYYKQNDLYDFRLMSTLGLTDADAEAIGGMEGVREVQPAYQLDAVIREQGGEEDSASSDSVMRFHSLPAGNAGINRVIVNEGRLPEAPDECVVVSRGGAGGAGAFSVGDVIEINLDEDPDVADQLSQSRFTVVGLVNSPLYMSLDSSGTSKGSGTVRTYLYIPEEAFSMEAYTELYLTLDGASELFCFGEEYESLTDAMERELKAIGVERCEIRRAEVVGEAEETLADAQAEYEEKKAEAEEKLADAERQLADARQELADGEAELADARQKYADAQETLADGETELADKQREYDEAIASAEKRLADAREEIAKNEEALAGVWDQLGTARAQLQSAQSQLDSQRDALKEQQLSAYRLIEAGVAQAVAQIEANTGLTDEQKQAAIAQARAAGEAKKQEADAQLEPYRQQLAAAAGTLNSSWNEYYAKRAQAAEGDEALADGKAELADKTAEFEREKADGARQLADARQELADGKAELADARREIADGEQRLADGKTELADAQAEYEEKKAEADEKLADAKAQIDDAATKIADIKSPDWYALNRDANPGYISFAQDTERIDAIAMVFPVFFFLVAALVCLTTMTRMVEEERTQLGVLKALGYRKGAVVAKYLLYAAVTSLIGSTVGLLIGFQVFPRVIWAAYGIMYTTPPIMTPFNWEYAVMAAAFFMVATIGATFAACWGELSSAPAELIRPKPPKSGKRIFLERIPFLWRRMSFSKKLTARNILRDKKRFFMTVIGVTGCTALMLTGFGLKDSISGIVPNQFGELFRYDMQGGFSHDVTPGELTAQQRQALDAIEQDSRISESILLHQESVTALSEGNATRMDAYLVVPEEPERMSDFVVFRERRGKKPVGFPQEGAVITEKLASELGLKTGGELLLEDADGRQYPVAVAGIIENYVYNYVYISPQQYARTYGEDCAYRSFFAIVDGSGKELENALSGDLLQNSEILSVSFNSVVTENFSQIFDRLDLVVLVLIISASLLAFVVLYNLTNINIMERLREIATIKVLGFHNREVDWYVYRENVILTLIGMLLGFVGGVFLHQYVMRLAEVNLVMFGREIAPLSYLWAGLLTFAFAALVNFAMHFRLKKISMVESLKSIE